MPENNNTIQIQEKDSEKKYWVNMKTIGIIFLLSPVLLFLIAYILSEKNFAPQVADYEEGLARIIQYILFALGAAVFFFCDAISDFLQKRFFIPREIKSYDSTHAKENLSAYFAYTLVMMGIVDTIGIYGFAGFLICSNLTWLGIFALLNIALQFKYYPSESRFNSMISEQKL